MARRLYPPAVATPLQFTATATLPGWHCHHIAAVVSKSRCKVNAPPSATLAASTLMLCIHCVCRRWCCFIGDCTVRDIAATNRYRFAWRLSVSVTPVIVAIKDSGTFFQIIVCCCHRRVGAAVPPLTVTLAGKGAGIDTCCCRTAPVHCNRFTLLPAGTVTALPLLSFKLTV